MSPDNAQASQCVTRWLERDGVAVSWREAGKGAALVLLHAFPLSAAMWNALVQRWKHAFHLVCPVWRGFDGPSPMTGCPSVSSSPAEEVSLPVLGALESAPSLVHYAEDVASICSVAGIESAIFAGCSMGGYVMLELLRRHANLVRAAIFCDTRPEADSDDGRAARLETNRWLDDMVGESGAETAGTALAERTLPRLLGASTRQHRPEIVRQVRSWIEHAPADAVICANAAMAARPDSRELLPDLHIPALVIAGEEDVIIPPQDAAAFSALIPGATLCIVPGSGHLLPVELPQRFAQEVENWLKAHKLYPQ